MLIEKLRILLDTNTDILRHQSFRPLHGLFFHHLCLFRALVNLITIVLGIRASTAFGPGRSLSWAGCGGGGIISGTPVRVDVVRFHKTLVTFGTISTSNQPSVSFLMLQGDEYIRRAPGHNRALFSYFGEIDLIAQYTAGH